MRDASDASTGGFGRDLFRAAISFAAVAAASIIGIVALVGIVLAPAFLVDAGWLSPSEFRYVMLGWSLCLAVVGYLTLLRVVPDEEVVGRE